MSSIFTSQITSVSIVYSIVCSGADQSKQHAPHRGTLHRIPRPEQNHCPIVQSTFSNVSSLMNFLCISFHMLQDFLPKGPSEKYLSVADMMTSSNGNIFRVTGPLCGEFTGPGEFPAQRPVTRSFDVFFDLRLNKWLSKQSWGWWLKTLSRPLWRHRNEQSRGQQKTRHVTQVIKIPAKSKSSLTE